VRRCRHQRRNAPGGVLTRLTIRVSSTSPAPGSATSLHMNQTLGYARVSTADQNPDLQVDELTAAGCHRIFVEHTSGARAERPQLAQALGHLRSGDTLVVWRLDRLARSLRDLIDIVTTLEQRGVGFRSLHERVDTTSPGGRLVFHLFGALAEFERDLIRERSLGWQLPELEAATAAGPP
jgi:DNA invertase Pin-like site-specific DNA recombinase